MGWDFRAPLGKLPGTRFSRSSEKFLPIPGHLGFQPQAAAGEQGVKPPPRWPPFCASAGSRGRSPSASGDAVKVPPPSWSSAPGGSPPQRGRPRSSANLPDPGQPPSPPGRPWPREEGRPPRRSGDHGAAGRAAVASRNVWDPKAEATARDEPPFRSSAPGCSESCSRLRPSQGRGGRGRTALQWPARQTALVGQGRGQGRRGPSLEKGCCLLLLETWLCASLGSSYAAQVALCQCGHWQNGGSQTLVCTRIPWFKPRLLDREFASLSS